MSANFLYSADIQNTAASAVVTDNKLHDASIDDHCDNGHLAPNGDCIIGKNQAISADGQHAHQQKCRDSFNESQPDVIMEKDTCIVPSQREHNEGNLADKQCESAMVESTIFVLQVC